jgi:hypothetical protein
MLCADVLCAQTLIERYRAAFTLKPEEGISFTADTTTRLANAAVPAVNLTASGFVLIGSGNSENRIQATTPDGRTFTPRTTTSGLSGFADGSTIYLPDGRMRYIGQEISPTHTQQRPRQRIASWISSDGLTWTKENGVRFQPGVLDDSAAGVPYCLQVKDSAWRLYYVGDLMGNYGKTVGRAFNGVRTAISNDWGQTFTPEKTTNVTREGDVDPHVVYLTNGKFRMYLKSAKSMGATVFIESTDGVNFDTTKFTEAIKSTAGGIGGGGRFDPFVVKFPDGRVICFHGTDDGVQGGRQKIIGDAGTVQTSAVAQQQSDMRVTVAPNPVAGLMALRWTLHAPERVVITLHNTAGSEVLRVFEGDCAAGTTEQSFSTHLLPQGAYSLRVQTGTLFTTKPVQVLR